MMAYDALESVIGADSGVIPRMWRRCGWMWSG